MDRSFKLAPMSMLIRGLTVALLGLPLFFGLHAFASHRWVTGAISLVLIALYAVVWVWCRPSRFVVSETHLEVIFPGWRRRIPLLDLTEVQILNKASSRQAFGWSVRIGVGGLWGGFGWLWTKRRGLLDFYISRVDGLVLIQRSTGRDLLISPENPVQMAGSLQK
ncbi:hypothetical protein D1AOALGA4SA_2017 [Olavius algarvensis Delta 1 endosymbiont]|nr:hypothetical protein D1AOALGA4SA_2017 [Olavius algarvensis Delta 1 endosymbiont]